MPTTTEPTLTPYELEILLHYYSKDDDHRYMSTNNELWRNTIASFRVRNLLQDNITRDTCYELAPRGRAYIEHLLRQPLPVCKWVVE